MCRDYGHRQRNHYCDGGGDCCQTATSAAKVLIEHGFPSPSGPELLDASSPRTRARIPPVADPETPPAATTMDAG
jgi:hypothetical protein